MPRNKFVAWRLFSIFIVGLVASVQNVAVGAEATISVSIAVPDLPDSFTSDGTGGRDLAKAIVSELQADGRFTLVNSNISLEANAAVPQFDKWRSTDAKWLVAGSITKLASLSKNGMSRALVHIRVWNVLEGSPNHDGWAYIGDLASLQRVPRDVVPKIIRQLTSEPHAFGATSDRPN